MQTLKHKYKAKPTVVDNIRFGSKKEAAYYQKLKLLKRAGDVVGFFRQVPLYLSGKNKYVMDFFVFYADGHCEAIEVKGFETPVWKIKQKLVVEEYPWLDLIVV